MLLKKERWIIMKNGFTLAEILITIGIIGVVSAMTIPTLVTNYQKKQTAQRLKKSYAELQQAIKLSEAENDDVSGWNYSQDGDKFFDQYIAPYMKGIIKKDNINLKDTYKTLSDKNPSLWVVTQTSKTYTFLNGISLSIAKPLLTPTTTGFDILIDINGVANSPNKFGKDTFVAIISKNYGLYFAGQRSGECTFPTEYNTDRNILINDNTCHNYRCKKGSQGVWCGALIMADGWEIKSDYPW